ncbi:isochorismatase domain-containing protein 2-like isoform X2 [Tigriopus californicus]|uniref:isochorismatase domain-containing protein 2-like isoform X2 n=1 Tax=Tigriopus californicus TaxID=6832 RepID=UPI0027DA7975|nr:isochorismatase domain-containing protein 2-like isoform X2 [Tigriopus californicus]|eukprot:TCALIF_00897-PA protein Name:"Similar to isoc2 Isochorismatase domain-containing protein 2, mitochondrial (Xenopus laevis)" AED:0.04 eAED:0.04 QI:302/1/0.66/1/0.5/0.66/3/0/212
MEDNARKLGQLIPENSVLFVCDLQERFAPSILHFDTIVSNADRMIQMSQVLHVPIITTEQYPKGLGNTVAALKCHLHEKHIFSKTRFTMMIPEVENRLEELRTVRNVDTVILVGIETHVCIIATCQDLIQKGYNVHVVADACSSRTQTDRQLALERMKQIGAFINSTESVILSLAGDAAHPQFKQIQTLIKTLNPSTDLVRESSKDGLKCLL